MNKTGAIILIVLSVFLSVYFYRHGLASSGEFFLKCPSKSFFKVDCPLCGGQRYLYNMLHFDIKTALRANALLFFLFPLIAYDFLRAVSKPFGFKLPRFHFNKTFYICLIVIIIFFTVLRNIPLYPFNLLRL